MDGDRGTGLIARPVQWACCSHRSTVLLDGGGVALEWSEVGRSGGPEPGTVGSEGPSGLAFDAWFRAYRTRPLAGRIEVQASDIPPERGGRTAPGPLREPRGLAVDGRQRLYVAEAGAGAIHVVDLGSQRLLRRVRVRSAGHPRRHPVDVAARCCGAVALLHDPVGVIRLQGRRGPCAELAPRAPDGFEGVLPTRVAAIGADVLLLWSTGDRTHAVVARTDGTVVAEVDGATDLAVGGDGVLVVARGQGLPLHRFRQVGDDWPEIEPLGAPGHDGGAVALAPDGRVGYTTPSGFRWTTGPRIDHRPTGSVTSYRMDSGTYRTRWGRVFLDACIPAGTAVRARFLTTDEDDVDDPVDREPPSRGGVPAPPVDTVPPLPPRSRLDQVGAPVVPYRRPTGREWPWAQISADDRFETYEAPVRAPAGRYLWLVLELEGGGHASPRVREVRVERPGHRLLHRLPRSWSRIEEDASFLHRVIAPAEGLVHELDERAVSRDLLLEPAAVPQEALGWLAGLVGMTLDRRWPERARRQLVAEAFTLYRIRGTQQCLERILALYLGFRAPVVEHWRLRGLGGALLGTRPGGPPAPAVGGAATTRGSLGHFTVGGQTPGEDGYTAAAHRFSVLVPARLGPEQQDAVQAIMAAHKPAHTLGEVCELGPMQVGRQLHLDLTAVVGPPGTGWTRTTLGAVRVGTDGVVGQPALGARVGQTAVGGAVRVG